MKKLILLLPLIALTGCAAGSATAAYSLKALEADSVSSECENRIVERVKNEIEMEFDLSQP